MLKYDTFVVIIVICKKKHIFSFEEDMQECLWHVVVPYFLFVQRCTKKILEKNSNSTVSAPNKHY